MSATPKFVFECLEGECPDRKCCNRSPVLIYFEDLKRWTLDHTMNIVFSNLEFTIQEDTPYPIIILKKYPNETLCTMFNKETKTCNIYYSKPISCAAYPLGFNGNAFYIVNKECSGLGKGSMTKEALKEMRDRAQLEHECKTKTIASLPLLQMLFLQFFQKQSQQAMESLSEEDRKRIEEILEKKGDNSESDAPE
ncbi:MAG TPA: YkgJ family cysteine cluster protein [Candidatus Deferrimicrobium sp.]|nr:YkgJ family cysteine cluster protein [Candidatus Deferrimicrobium sp.]